LRSKTWYSKKLESLEHDPCQGSWSLISDAGEKEVWIFIMQSI